MNQSTQVTHFDRFEFKYLLNAKLRNDFESELLAFMDLDPYVDKQQHSEYFVRSLYFDTPQLQCFYDKVDGLKRRHKFRVRTYTDTPSPETPQFLEIKGRYNQFVFKHRVELEYQDESLERRLRHQALNSTVIEQFQFEYFKRQIRPVALIDYWRRPYISKYDPEFRLTFDHRLQATATRELSPHEGEDRREFLSGYTVMEVKFKRQFPAWFHGLLQAYELERLSISKICRGMEALGIAEDI